MTVDGGRIVVRVEGRDVGLSSLLTQINQRMGQAGVASRSYATAIGTLSPAAARANADIGRYAQSLAAVAAKSGDTSGAIRILGGALQQMVGGTVEANRVQLQLQNTLNQQAAASSRATQALVGFSRGFFFIGQAVQTAIGLFDTFIAKPIEAGNALEKQLVTFRVLSGTQASYEKNLAAAREQQDRFGGSLQDTVEGMQGFAVLARNTGVDIQKLTNLARAMSIVDPAQGFKGKYVAPTIA